MAGYTLLVLLPAVLLSTREAQGVITTHNLTEPTTISFSVPPDHWNSEITWLWSRDKGRWGLDFLHLDLNAGDVITITYDGHTIPPITSKSQKLRKYYTKESRLKIGFKSSSRESGERFKILVVYGETGADLDREFQTRRTLPPTDNEEDYMYLVPIVLAVTVTVAALVLVCICTLTLLRHRRRRQLQEVSVSVNVEGRIRRSSGVRYTRKTSQSQETTVEDPPASPTRGNPIVRTPSNRSWAVRAEMTTTTANGRQQTQNQATGNLYTPMENMIKSELVVVSSRAKEKTAPARGRLPTLEKVPEDELQCRVPLTTPHQDDGYISPTKGDNLLPVYMNSPAAEKFEVERSQTKVGSLSSAGSIDSYQNITVHGKLQLS